MYFAYGENEISYLKSKDEKLAEVIEKIGMIERETDTDPKDDRRFSEYRKDTTFYLC